MGNIQDMHELAEMIWGEHGHLINLALFSEKQPRLSREMTTLNPLKSIYLYLAIGMISERSSTYAFLNDVLFRYCCKIYLAPA